MVGDPYPDRVALTPYQQWARELTVYDCRATGPASEIHIPRADFEMEIRTVQN
jgi:hypothetical protein